MVRAPEKKAVLHGWVAQRGDGETPMPVHKAKKHSIAVVSEQGNICGGACVNNSAKNRWHIA